MWCSYYSRCFVCLTYPFASSKRHKFEISPLINNKILWFEVSQYNLLMLQILQHEDHGRYVELAVFSAEESNIPNYIVQFHSPNELEYVDVTGSSLY